MVHDVKIEGGFVLFDLLLRDFLPIDSGEDFKVLSD
jgi:hypothetical protein